MDLKELSSIKRLKLIELVLRVVVSGSQSTHQVMT